MVGQIIFPSYVSTTTIAIFIIFFISSAPNGDAYDYNNCLSPWPCGKITHIGYPFWGGERPKYCGHPDLRLQCPPDAKDSPILQIGDPGGDGSVSFLVLGISNCSKSFSTIKLIEKHPNSKACPTDFIQNHVFKDIFRFSPNVSITRLFHDCPDSAHNKPPTNELVTCSDIAKRNRTAYYKQNFSDSKSIDGIYKNCKFYEAPVLTEELNRLKQGKETLTNVLKQGFEVEFNFTDCINCQNSGGVCGFSPLFPYPFVCYCKNLPHSKDCRKSGKWKQKLILGLAIPGGFCILIAINVALCCCMKKIKLQTPALLSKTLSYYHTMSDIESGNSFFGIPVFSYNELQEATNNFDSAQELGDGGFGVVYYGKLQDGREVAVKRLYEKNYKRVGQFMNEVEILTKLRHQNLVTLYGCTSRHSRELLLVYEYIPNGTVADHLYGEQSRSGTLPWSIRMKIAIQTACALSYLHASDIVHRDVKTNNILLDSNFTVKVADFGLSRLFPFDATHVSTAPQGTPGYLDPEYHKCYQVTNKSDVYSFGVVLIELISSLPAIDINRHHDEINLSDYAMNKIQKGELETLVDRNLGFESDFKVKRMTTLVAEIAFQCLQQEKEVRPSMEEVFEALKRIECVDYEALESEEMGWSMGILKPTSEVGENDVDYHQEHPCSPKSLIENWVSRSSVASDPRSQN